MAKLPHPPERLPALRSSDIRELRAGTLLWRAYFMAGPHPTAWSEFRHFGPLSNARFDHHVPPPAEQDRGILYAGQVGPVAVAETFQSSRVINRIRHDPWLVGFRLTTSTVLLDLSGRWPTRAGSSQAIASGRRDVAREWSRAIYEQYEGIHGIRYPSSMYGGRHSLALYERVEYALPPKPSFHVPLTHPGLKSAIENIADDVGYGVL